jgi:hypothetical protein
LGQIYADHDCLLSKEKSARHWLRKFVKGQYGRDEDVLSEAEEDEAKENVQKEGNNIAEKKGALILVALGGEGKGPGEEKLEAEEGVEKCETFHSLMGTVNKKHKTMRYSKRLKQKLNTVLSDDEQEEAQSILERPSNEESMPEDSRNEKLMKYEGIVKSLEEMLVVPDHRIYSQVSLLILEFVGLEESMRRRCLKRQGMQRKWQRKWTWTQKMMSKLYLPLRQGIQRKCNRKWT